MHCKNCQAQLSKSAKFCENCGAQVVTERITAKPLIGDFFTKVFGWESKYFVTVRTMYSRPHILLQEYLSGTRKKYVNPFAFLAIGAAISALVFNLFMNDYLRVVNSLTARGPVPNSVQIENGNNPNPANVAQQNPKGETTPQEQNLSKAKELSYQFQMGIVKYYNFLAFLSLPIAALLFFWTFGNPYNYVEHLIIVSYQQGAITLFNVVMFLLSIFLHPYVFFGSAVLNLVYTFYVYAKLYEYSFGKTFLKFLKYTLINVLVVIVFAILVALILVPLVKNGALPLE